MTIPYHSLEAGPGASYHPPFPLMGHKSLPAQPGLYPPAVTQAGEHLALMKFVSFSLDTSFT